MKNSLLALVVALLGQLPAAVAQTAAAGPSGPITLVIHGGAGTITKANMTAEKEKAYQEALNQALQAGYTILKRGGTSLDAVEASRIGLGKERRCSQSARGSRPGNTYNSGVSH